ncbi:hypothetical protein [Methylobacterium sp. R2-1]|uniref:hypothetical protein n=1 Tax=Methylobacterium sp. R2-1 TaxID=2587064 RepID=UPI00161C93FB|nr:hypothetical protein [Methylobacterium sp. R2-1]MBB2964333.1 hypothetical protein [Methylobacterium sp. R2-1]
MSEVDVFRNIAAHLEADAEPVSNREEAITQLSEMTVASARYLAESIFLKLRTEPGWTHDQARALVERTLDGHARATAETFHGLAAPLEMALQVGEAAFEAFRSRMVELAISQGDGGAA